MAKASREQIRLARQMAAHSMHAKHDSKAVTAAARKGFMARFEREVDPDGVLPPEERLRRAQHAMKAHMLHLAHKSAAVNKKKQRADGIVG